ncbi:hypothetical protein [Nocardia sp. NPDC051570]|uniref:hypothetical protein n=1 Tax=Nocardia sp. NPDC051570 TaxID=3364324 RepID=UPI0037B06A2F
MNQLERQLLSLADRLREAPETGDIDGVRRAVLAMATEAQALDAADPDDQAVRRLYDYVDASSRQAVRDPQCWRVRERSDIDIGLSAVLAASRRGGSVYALSCIRDDLSGLSHRIEALASPDREMLRDLFAYVGEKNRQALDLAVRATWHVPWTELPAPHGSVR